MGGVWERVIRSARKVLGSLLRDQLVSGEAPRTVMTEVKSVLKSRPLTLNRDSPTDFEALTPNHLLLLRPNGSMPPGVFSKDDLYCKRRWRQIQYLADVFWKKMAVKLFTCPSRTPKMDKTVTEFLCWRLGFGC